MQIKIADLRSIFFICIAYTYFYIQNVQATDPICPTHQDQNSTLILLPNDKNCSTFFMCDNGKAVLMECPPGLYFSADCFVCVNKEDAHCLDGSISFEILYQCNNVDEITYTVNPYDCTSYLMCRPDDDIAELHYCSDGLFFDPVKLECNDIPCSVEVRASCENLLKNLRKG